MAQFPERMGRVTSSGNLHPTLSWATFGAEVPSGVAPIRLQGRGAPVALFVGFAYGVGDTT